MNTKNNVFCINSHIHTYLIYYFAISSMIALFSSCNTDTKPKTILSDTTVLSPPLKIEPVLNGEYFSSIEPIVLETNPQCQIGRIDKFTTVDNKIYILDYHQKVLLIFDINGKFLHKINNVGKGPGEYRVLADFWIDIKMKRIEIYDMEKIISYNYEGKFIDEIKTDAYANNFSKTNNGNYYIWTGTQTDRKTNGTLNFLDKDGKLIERYFEWNGVGGLTSNHDMFSQNSNSGIIFQPFNFDYFIRELNDNGINEKYYVNFGNYSLNGGYLKNLINSKNLNGRLSSDEFINHKKCAHGIRNVIETKDYISFRYLIGGDMFFRTYLYSKKKHKAITCLYPSKKSLLPQSIMLFSNADANTNIFYSHYDAFDLLTFTKSRLDKMKDSEKYDKILALINSITPNSNPIIFKLKVNDKVFDEN